MGGPALGRVTRITWPGQARSRRWSQFTARCYGADAMGQQSAEDGPSLGHEALAYADTLYNLARYLTGNVADAEDLVQETYARAIQATDGSVHTRKQPQGVAVPNLEEYIHQRLQKAAS
jgi:hypothetical protein